MQSARPTFRCFLSPLRFLALLFVACHLGQETKVDDTLSFTKQYESLSKFDTVHIEVRDENGRTLAIIYQGKVDTVREIQNLSVPGWKGGPIDIVITAYQIGNPDAVYQEVKRYNGTTGKTEKTLVHIHPNPGLSSGSLLLQFNEGQIIPLPKVDITPANLAKPELEWSSSNPEVLKVAEGRLVAGATGSAQLTAKLLSHPGKTLVFEVQVLADPKVPASLFLDRDTLYLAENGAPRGFGLDIKPATASSDVLWTLKDSTLAALRTDGRFQGLKRGTTKVIVASKLKASVKDSAYITVTEPVPVASVRFPKAKTTLYLGGSAEVLTVEVLPPQANSEVDFHLSDITKATLAADTLKPLAEGSLRVFVRSREDTSKSDTLEVAIEKPVPVSEVVASEAALTLYMRGEDRTVTAKVIPANAPQDVRWISLSPSIASVGAATGTLQALKPGLSAVVAVSLADSSRKDTIQVSVKEDIPILSVGEDTTVSAGQIVSFLPVVTQEYGKVVMYKWDLDGNLVWDDTATDIAPKTFKYEQPREYGARFYVRDTEGNEAIKTRRVLVVSSAAVLITAPPDNFHTNKKVIAVEWSVNGKRQDSLTSHTLASVGPNTLTRTARDSAGKEFSHSITVHYDTTSPAKPILTGSSPTNVKPKWSWTSGGGGTGEYRFRLGDEAFPADAPNTRDTSHTLAANPVSGNSYTLYVQEKDLAGNWSPSASLLILYNVTQPVVVIESPRASGTHYTSTAAVTLSGKASGPVGISKVTYKVGAGVTLPATFAAGAWSTPALTLQEGVATGVTITATDIAGNTGEAALTLFHDKTAPSPPNISTAPPAISSSRKATFGWTEGNGDSGGSGLNGAYRYRLNGAAWVLTRVPSALDLALVEGDNLFEVQVQDFAENWSASTSARVNADTRGPVLGITYPAATGGSYVDTGKVAVPIGGTVVDSGIGVKEVACELAGATTGSFVAKMVGSNWSVAPTFNSGSTTVRCTGVDGFDKAGVSANITVTIAIPLPRISNLDIPSGMVLNKSEINVSYDVTVNGTVTREASLLKLAEGVNNPTLTTTATNVIGQKGSLAVSYVRRANVVFVDKQAKGKSDGSSWQDAYTSIENGAHDKLFSAGGAMLWVSRGEYGTSAATSVTLPLSGRIIGGFNAATLPSDTIASARDLVLNRTMLRDFHFKMASLAGRFEFNGLELDDGNLKAFLTLSPQDGTGVISYVNCLITKNWQQYGWYEVTSNNPVRWEMIGCTIGGNYPDGKGPNQFNLFFDAPGDFYARNTRFVRNRQDFTRGPFLRMSQVDGLLQRAQFEGCELNYFVHTNGGDRYQLSLQNPNSTLTISGSKVLGGTTLIQAEGNLFYGNDNVTIPFEPIPIE